MTRKTGWMQNNPRSCTAAALIAAAIDLGITHLPSRTFDKIQWPELELNPDIDENVKEQVENLMYSVTSQQTDKLTEDSDNLFSTPSGIIKAAKALGLEIAIYIKREGTAFNTMLEELPDNFYDEEKIMCEELGCPIIETDTVPEINENQRILLTVLESVTNTPHTVVRYHDNTYMDPYSGKIRKESSINMDYADSGTYFTLSTFTDFNIRNDKENKLPEKKYIDGGMYIVLSKQ